KGTLTLTGTAKLTDNGNAGTSTTVGANRAAGFLPVTQAGGSGAASARGPAPFGATVPAAAANANGATGQGGGGGTGTNTASTGGALTQSTAGAGGTGILSWQSGLTSTGLALSFATS